MKEMVVGRGMVEEAELIGNCLRGDQSAFGELVRRYWPGVVGMTYRLTADSSLAQDLAQETFVRAWQKMASYRGESFKGWLFSIAHNLTIDELRRRRPTVELAETEPAREQGPEHAAIASERRERVIRAVSSLPVHYRSTLALREYGGLSYAEIAEAQGVPIGTIMSRLSSARKLLKEKLKDFLAEEVA